MSPCGYIAREDPLDASVEDHLPFGFSRREGTIRRRGIARGECDLALERRDPPAFVGCAGGMNVTRVRQPGPGLGEPPRSRVAGAGEQVRDHLQRPAAKI